MDSVITYHLINGVFVMIALFMFGAIKSASDNYNRIEADKNKSEEKVKKMTMELYIDSQENRRTVMSMVKHNIRNRLAVFKGLFVYI